VLPASLLKLRIVVIINTIIITLFPSMSEKIQPFSFLPPPLPISFPLYTSSGFAAFMLLRQGGGGGVWHSSCC
jgi:hypothetical protein